MGLGQDSIHQLANMCLHSNRRPTMAFVSPGINVILAPIPKNPCKL